MVPRRDPEEAGRAWTRAGRAADADRGGAWAETWERAVAAGDGAPEPAVTAAYEACLAAMASDRVGQSGLTREHLDVLQGPWRAAVTQASVPEGVVAAA